MRMYLFLLGWYLGNASLFTKFLFTILVPVNPPPSNSEVMDLVLKLYKKAPQTELRTLSQNCEQTLPKLRTNRIANKWAFLSIIGNENSAQSFSDRSFWESLRVVDVRAFGSWISAPKCLFFQDFERPDRSFGPGYLRE